MCVHRSYRKLNDSHVFSGYASVGSDKHLFVTNLFDGVDVYSLPPRVPVEHYTHPILQNRPLQVSPISGSMFVIGSEDGHIVIWNWRTNEKAEITHANRTRHFFGYISSPDNQ